MSRTRPAATSAAAVVLVGLAAGCSSAHGDPSAGSFRHGACRSAAAAVLSAGEAARDAQSRDAQSRDGARIGDLVALTRAQQRLETVRRDATPAERRQLDRLVSAIGLYRLHAVGHTVSPAVARAVVTAQHGVVIRCVAQRTG